MTKTYVSAIRLVSVVSLLLACGCSSSPSPDATSTSDEAARALIEELRTKYREAGFYIDNAEYRERFAVKGNSEFFSSPPHVVSVLFERPNKFRITRQVPQTDGPGLSVVTASDGTTQRAFVSDLPTQFLEYPVADELNDETIVTDPVLRDELLPVPMANLFPQLDLLLSDEQRDDALTGTSYELLDELPLDSGPCQRVKIATDTGDRVAWIDKQSRLLRRLEFPSGEARKLVDPDENFSRYELWIDFVDASTDAMAADSAFELKVPEGANTVDKLTR